MGQDKALMNYHGKPQIEHVYKLLTIPCEEVFLSKRSDQQTYKLIPFINDDKDFLDHGPIGGILSAMKAYPDVSWLVMACDLPFVTEETIQILMRSRDPQKFATAFKSAHDGLPEPLCAIWENHAYSEILEFLKKDIHCPRKILINSDTKILEQENPRWLDNVNEPKEFQEALKIIR